MSDVSKNQLELNVDTISRKYLSNLRMDIMESYTYDEEFRHRADGKYQRDYARIMYSSSFRRLQGKMQLLGIKNDQFFRNRLTHSLEVAQIARSIAHTLKYDNSESYVVEAGALAHDLGNPPFGHSGERHLNDLFEGIGGFEGNAQTLRILTNVERKRADFRGLNLTYRVLLSVVKYFNKYNGEHKENKKQKFLYDDDYDLLDKFTKENSIKIRTMDVQIVDISDEIAYATHDLEDGLRTNAFTIDELLHDYQAAYGNTKCFQKLVGIVEEAKVKAGYGSNKIDSTQYSKLFRQELASRLINLFLNDIDLIPVVDKFREVTNTKQDEELGFTTYKELVKGLKELVFQCINHSDEVYSYEQQGNKILDFLQTLYSENVMYLPPEYRAKDLLEHHEELLSYYTEENLQQRLICDYISGMMDSYAISTYKKYSGYKI